MIALFESINQPLVNIPNFGTAPTGAFVLGTRNEYGYYTVFVYLYQQETRAVVVYVSEPRNLNAEQYRAEEQEAIRFVESMGFMIDNIHFPTLAQSEQEAVIARIPMFRPPEPTMNLYDAPEAPYARADSNPQLPPPSNPPGGGFPQAGADMFGGMNPKEGDVFRRAGLEPGQGMPLSNQAGGFGFGLGPAVGSGFPDSAPGSNPMTQPPMGQPPMNQPPMNQPPMSQPPMSQPPMTQPPMTQPPSAQAPASQPPAPTSQPRGQPLTPEALERLGRLLGAFSVLLGLLLTSGACVSGGTGHTIEERKKIESHIDLGNQHLIRGQPGTAIQNFEVVLDMDEDNRDALRGVGLAYFQLGRLPEAENYYKQAILADDTWSEPKNEYAVVLMETGRCEEAETLLRQVMKDIFYRTPEYAEHNLAKALDCQKKHPDAMKILEELVLKRPQFCLGYLTLAQLSSRHEKPAVTIEACDGFFTHCEQNEKIKKQISPEQSAMCYLEKGLAHTKLGDVESARASFMRCQGNGTFGTQCRRSLNQLPP